MEQIEHDLGQRDLNENVISVQPQEAGTMFVSAFRSRQILPCILNKLDLSYGFAIYLSDLELTLCCCKHILTPAAHNSRPVKV